MHGDYILVVDDDPAIRLILSDLLEDEGFQVRTAVNGLDALSFCERREPVLLVTDLDMPRMSGTELIEQLDRRGMGSFPVVVISGKPELLSDTEGLTPRVESKPLDLASLVKRVRMLVGASRDSQLPRRAAQMAGVSEGARTPDGRRERWADHLPPAER